MTIDFTLNKVQAENSFYLNTYGFSLIITQLEEITQNACSDEEMK
jgi:hypothetical protein